MNAAPITLNAKQIDFLQGNVVIYAATADAAAHPHVARVAGTRIDSRKNAVTIFLSALEASALLADVRAQQALAVVFCEPGSEKAMQLKAHSAQIVAVQRDDQRLVADYCERLIKHVTPLGFSSAMLRTFFAPLRSDIVALQFTPCAAFDQTPGPNAGTALVNPT